MVDYVQLTYLIKSLCEDNSSTPYLIGHVSNSCLILIIIVIVRDLGRTVIIVSLDLLHYYVSALRRQHDIGCIQNGEDGEDYPQHGDQEHKCDLEWIVNDHGCKSNPPQVHVKDGVVALEE